MKYKKQVFEDFLNGFSSKVVVLVVMLCTLNSCQSQTPSKQGPKLNGISLVASRDLISSDHIQPIVEVNANAVAVMPFAFMDSLSSPDLKFNNERQWQGERLDGVRKTTNLLHEKGLKVMVKPQIWIRRGEFTGNIKMTSEEDWVKFEAGYKEFIMLYAKMAAEENVEIICLGTELYEFANERSAFWKELIAEIRTFYKGELTYAENWDKVDNVQFWNELDLIGVDAYFPLHEDRSPSLEQLREAWKPHKEQLKKLSSKNAKQIVFTEYGYRNTDYAAKQPWDSSREITSVNDQLQADALLALYQEFWKEDWFAGGFLWKWFHDIDRVGRMENNQFTPQNKPALETVRSFYGEVLRN